MGAVSEQLNYVAKTCGHEVLGLRATGQRLRSRGHSLSGGEGSALPRRLDVLFATLPTVFSQAIRSGHALTQSKRCANLPAGGACD